MNGIHLGHPLKNTIVFLKILRVIPSGVEDWRNHIFIDLSIHEGLPIEQAHAIAHEVEAKLKSNFEGIEDVVVHLEPDGH